MNQKKVNLQKLHTFGIAVYANRLERIHKITDIHRLMREGIFEQKHLILGGGSNVLFAQNFDGTVVKNELKGIRHHISNNQVLLTAASGEVWHEVVQHALANNFGGIENLSLIPGTIGAAPIQNIGAYGVELKDVFFSLEAMDLTTGDIKIFYKDDCTFGYRDSIFKNSARGRYFITSVTLILSLPPHALHLDYGSIKQELEKMAVEPTIQSVSQAVINIRTAKLPNPTLHGNAGSFFKNVEVTGEKWRELLERYPTLPYFKTPNGHYKIPTGWLIEQCGWKGKQHKHAGCHKDQALVLVNLGDAKPSDIIELAQKITLSVYDTFGIHLEPEVNIIT